INRRTLAEPKVHRHPRALGSVKNLSEHQSETKTTKPPGLVALLFLAVIDFIIVLTNANTSKLRFF
ncbi:hypothetical protein, partial [Thiomicrospira sp.]|uniref:hypothetical protein n=1 Tax=Thiomicrospira sp. TaxID=935 RepID=UPI0025E85CCE